MTASGFLLTIKTDFERHCGQADDSLGLSLIRLWRKREPESRKFLGSGCEHDGGESATLFANLSSRTSGV
jgi:hypothetical protein